MKIMQYTDKGPHKSRRTLHVTRERIVIKYERPKVGGGWYTDMDMSIPWPWRKL